MTIISYYSDGKLHRLSAQPASRLTARAPRRGTRAAESRTTGPMAMRALLSQSDRVETLMHEVSESQTLIAVPPQKGPAVVPTPTLLLEGTGKANLRRISNEFGVEVIHEGREGKMLLQAKEGGAKGVEIAAAAARKAYKEGYARIAHPNFLRVMTHIKPSAAGGEPLWNHSNDGNPGVIGADVAAAAAWTITQGDADIRVAVLDEGVDTKHPALKPAVVAEKDFVDGNPTAAPDANDAHGTACAGIILSRSSSTPGLAPKCSLVAVRIAKGDGNDGWIIDDYQTADAIDWSWKEAKADVLSNSWGGGPPVDGVTAAFT
ncbi:MAG TPA: S8 family serine peptidase, partial [Lacipirellulaceae bacterium]|nr:S8 family serine peptidase [Lacipirellulaceae bacterium]